MTTVTRALDKHNMTLKLMRRVAEQQKLELRQFYQYRPKMLGCRSYHLVFIDESGFNKSGMYQRKGWAPKGSRLYRRLNNPTWTQTATSCSIHTERGKAVPLLIRICRQAYFEDFIEQLLRHCEMARARDRTYHG